MFARLILTVLVCAAASAGGDAFAGGPPPADRDLLAPSAPPSEPVDESALRYYASVKQTARAEAEIRRLQRLNPNWSPQADLWTARPSEVDEGPLWELFAADDLDKLHKAIEELRVAHPDWTPSADLARKLLRKDMRARIVAARRMGSWAEVAAAADQEKFEEDTSDVEILWDISDAYARTKRANDAFRILSLILSARSDPNERIGTIHRAIVALPMADVERLLDLGRKDAVGVSEFDAISIDITRARISAFLHDDPAREVSAAELARFSDFALTSADANQPALIAWYALKRNDLREALEWFKQAVDRGGDALVAHGLALTLKRLGQLREAEEVAYAWREPLPANAILFIDVLADQLTQPAPLVIDRVRMARYAAVTEQMGSGEGAQALAWYAYNSCQFPLALEWFKRAMAWFPKEGTAFGYALTLRRLKRHQEFVEIVNRYDGLFPKVLALLFPVANARSDMVCETRAAEPNARGQKKTSAFLDLREPGSPAATDGRLAPPQIIRPPTLTLPRSREREGRGLEPAEQIVPMPRSQAVRAEDIVPLVKRSDFPIPVLPENPLRFAASGRPPIMTAAGAGNWRPQEPFAAVTVARRVPGVGPMPYERFGLKLMPGWNGASQPSAAPDAALRAPIGTVWHTEYMATPRAGETFTSEGTQPIRPREAVSNAAPLSRFHP